MPQSLVDVSDIAEAIGKAQGGFYALVNRLKRPQEMGFHARGPWCGGMIAYRKSWFEEVGSPSSRTPGRNIARSARS